MRVEIKVNEVNSSFNCSIEANTLSIPKYYILGHIHHICLFVCPFNLTGNPILVYVREIHDLMCMWHIHCKPGKPHTESFLILLVILYRGIANKASMINTLNSDVSYICMGK